jgi:(+)-pinoresinol hydroxylase
MKHFAFISLGVLTLASFATPVAGADMTGQEVFDHYCTDCHGSADGPGTTQLGRTRGKDKGLLTQRKDLAPEYIAYIVRHGLRSMPPFAPSDLTEARLKALVEFLTKPRSIGERSRAPSVPSQAVTPRERCDPFCARDSTAPVSPPDPA